MEESVEVVLTARRTESVDAPAIEKLMSGVTFELFGRVDIVRIMYVVIYVLTLYKQSISLELLFGKVLPIP
jgi:hypothetical protein